MTTKQALYLGVAAVVIAAVWAGSVFELGAQQPSSAAVPIDNDDIGGIVTGPGGPEAGVWVIAETTELPTRFARIVVTDDQGRYVVPDLPKARYKVWVRGYGLVDSPKVDGEPGTRLNLRAVPAPNPAAALHVDGALDQRFGLQAGSECSAQRVRSPALIVGHCRVAAERARGRPRGVLCSCARGCAIICADSTGGTDSAEDRGDPR